MLVRISAETLVVLAEGFRDLYGLRKTTNISWMVGAPQEMRAEHLPDTSRENTSALAHCQASRGSRAPVC
jgi:hypothetical protein